MPNSSIMRALRVVRRWAFGEQEIALARERWAHYLTHGDPYYSPHLTQRGEDFSLNIEVNGAV